MTEAPNEARITAAINAEMNPEDAHAILAQAVVELRASLRAATERAEADSARVDWLQKQVNDAEEGTIGDVKIWGSWGSASVEVGDHYIDGDGANVREAIDAARSGSPNEGTE